MADKVSFHEKAGDVRKFMLFILVLCWLLSVVGGLGALARYAATPGVAHSVPSDWPKESHIPHLPGQATLLLFAHPHCPCTRATLTEWKRLLAQCGASVNAIVVFIQPADREAIWTHTDLWEQARTLPNVVIADANANEARRFRANTSGQVLLYSAEGRLLFRGGITPGRGHEGDSAGKDSVLALLHGDAPLRAQTSVFGCSLF